MTRTSSKSNPCLMHPCLMISCTTLWSASLRAFCFLPLAQGRCEREGASPLTSHEWGGHWHSLRTGFRTKRLAVVKKARDALVRQHSLKSYR